MRKTLKTFIVGAVLGLLLGLWFGINVGKENHLLSNPFAESSVKQQLREARDELRRRGADVIRGD